MNRRQLVGSVVAMAAAALLVANTSVADDKPAPAKGKKTFKCEGGNACKGTGACGAAGGAHDCAGKNECKGKGWVMTKNKKECDKMKAKLAEPEKKDEEKKS